MFELLRRGPESSASPTFTSARLITIFIIISITAIGLVLNFKNTSIIFNVIISTVFLIAIVFKLFLALVGSRFELHQAVTKTDVRDIVESSLPVYTI